MVEQMIPILWKQIHSHLLSSLHFLVPLCGRTSGDFAAAAASALLGPLTAPGLHSLKRSPTLPTDLNPFIFPLPATVSFPITQNHFFVFFVFTIRANSPPYPQSLEQKFLTTISNYVAHFLPPPRGGKMPLGSLHPPIGIALETSFDTSNAAFPAPTKERHTIYVLKNCYKYTYWSLHV